MPRRVDYASRFAFLREAAFSIVCDRGVDALSRRALAQQVGLSRARVDELLRADVPLVSLAAKEVVERRREGRWFLASAPPLDSATRLVCSLMADADHRVDEERVWIRLVSHPTARSGLTGYLADRDDLVVATIRQALGLLGVDESALPAQELHVRAMAEGLTLAVVLGRMTPADAVDVVARHLRAFQAEAFGEA
jgi:DNA-binding transcriptional ArsR family regulator